MAAGSSTAFGVRLRTQFYPARVLMGALVLAVLWEVTARIMTRGMAHPEYVMPDLLYVARHGLPGLSDYYSGGFGGTPPSEGGQASVGMGLLALAQHSAISLVRVTLGLVIGAVLGIGLGLLMTTLRPVREAVFGISNLLRMLPILALGPLFTLWFGPTTKSAVIFIAFAVGLLLLMGTIVAVSNLNRDHMHFAQTLGGSRMAVTRRVALPAIVPELAGLLIVAGPLAWSVLLASELYGIQDGLGWMMGQSLKFTLVARITVIAMAFIALTFLTLRLTQWAVNAATRWAE